MNAFVPEPVKQLSDAYRVDVRLHANTVVTLSNGQEEMVTIAYNAKNETSEMDHIKSGDTSFPSNLATMTRAPTYGKISTLQILIDRGSIEVFDTDGKVVMSNIIFSSSPYTQFTAKGGKARIYRLK